jgi:hypothetical protein
MDGMTMKDMTVKEMDFIIMKEDGLGENEK